MTTLTTHSPLAAASQDEIDLVRRIVAGDGSAFEQLMRQYNRRLFRVARAVLKDEAEAQDALQEAYLRAYRSIGQFRNDAALATWLSRLVLNECFGRLRRTARRQNVVPIQHYGVDIEADDMSIETPEAPDTALGRLQVRKLLERKLDELPEAFRLVFTLRAIEELSVEEVAQCLTIPEATVRTRHFRAKELLRESLARDIDVAERDIYEFGGRQCDEVVANVWKRLQAGAPP
jgi:RNA polymerase sigma-70 factor (ECF subfamily)